MLSSILFMGHHEFRRNFIEKLVFKRVILKEIRLSPWMEQHGCMFFRLSNPHNLLFQTSVSWCPQSYLWDVLIFGGYSIEKKPAHCKQKQTWISVCNLKFDRASRKKCIAKKLICRIRGDHRFYWCCLMFAHQTVCCGSQKFKRYDDESGPVRVPKYTLL